MTRQSFRRLIILELLLGVVILVVFFATQKYLPQVLRDYLEAEKNAEETTGDWIVLAIGCVYAIAYIVIYIGLYRFKAWAKTLLLPIHIIGVLLMLPYGPSVLSSWVYALSHCYSIVIGGILFLVYFSPVSQMFKNDSVHH